MKPSASLRIRAAGEALTLLPPGVVWWERERTLVVADLHVGMNDSARGADPVDLEAVDEKDLEELAAVAAERRADRLIVLGDFLQAPAGVVPDEAVRDETASDGAADREAHELAAAAHAWRERLDVPVWLLLGNHDAAIRSDPGAWPFDRVEDAVAEAPFLFTHRHRDLDARPAKEDPFRVAGHLHPVVRLEGRSRLQLRCFVVDAGQLILPAFGRMTAGAVVEPQPGRRRYPVTGDEVFDLNI